MKNKITQLEKDFEALNMIWFFPIKKKRNIYIHTHTYTHEMVFGGIVVLAVIGFVSLERLMAITEKPH